MIMKATDQRIRAEILARYDVDARRCREVFFPAGQQLHAQDAPLENIFLVISGSIFISKSSSNGLSGASCYECTHGCIGAMEIFLDTMRFDCSSVASTDVTTFLLPIDYVQELLQSSFTFVRQIASDLAEQLQHTHVILNDAQTHAAVERLARYLMVVSEQQLYRSGIQQAATAIGVSYLLQNVALFMFGANAKAFTSVVSVPAVKLADGQINITGETIVTIVTCLIIMAGLMLFINKTKAGQAMLAVSEDKGAAQLMGINVDGTIALTFAIGSGLAAVAGVLLCSAYPSLTPYTGSMPGIKAFVAAVFGGIGSIPGALVGGILLGIIEIFGKAYISSQMADAIVFAVLIVVLLVRPAGLFGKNIQEKV